MTRTEYLAQLEKYLKKLPAKDYQEAMDYFTEYFDEVGPEGEAAAIAELGSPKECYSVHLGGSTSNSSINFGFDLGLYFLPPRQCPCFCHGRLYLCYASPRG